MTPHWVSGFESRLATLLSTLPRQSGTGCMVVHPAYWGAAQAAEGVGGPLWKSVDKTESVYILLSH